MYASHSRNGLVYGVLNDRLNLFIVREKLVISLPRKPSEEAADDVSKRITDDTLGMCT